MNWLTTPAPKPALGTALLVVRLAVGSAFILHGLPKIQNASGWMNAMGLDTTIPSWLQAVAAVTEVGGGGAAGRRPIDTVSCSGVHVPDDRGTCSRARSSRRSVCSGGSIEYGVGGCVPCSGAIVVGYRSRVMVGG
jgi:DoxX